MAEKQEKKMCVICQKQKAFWKGNFDKCFDCAMSEEDRLRKEFIAILSPEQLVLFEIYCKASEEFNSMIDLD